MNAYCDLTQCFDSETFSLEHCILFVIEWRYYFLVKTESQNIWVVKEIQTSKYLRVWIKDNETKMD